MSFPNKAKRAECYAARDEYWSCMDRLEGKEEKAIQEECKQFKQLFSTICPAQWVGHFDRKYEYLKFKAKMDAGYEPIDEPTAKDDKK